MRSEEKRGTGHIGGWLTLYRTFFHLAGSILFIAAALLVARELIGFDAALYFILGALTAFITYQEFYLHPRYYRQIFMKGLIDWFAWVAPIGIYLFYFH
jgi:hypothetical protein